MSADVYKCTREQLEELISCGKCGTFGEDELRAIHKFLGMSARLYVGFVNGEVLGFYGVIPTSLISNTGYLWLETTPLVEKHVFTFIRTSRIAVQEMLQTYSRLAGQCRVDDEATKKRLAWLGAEFIERIPPYVKFEICQREAA